MCDTNTATGVAATETKQPTTRYDPHLEVIRLKEEVVILKRQVSNWKGIAARRLRRMMELSNYDFGKGGPGGTKQERVQTAGSAGT